MATRVAFGTILSYICNLIARALYLHNRQRGMHLLLASCPPLIPAIASSSPSADANDSR